MPEDKVGALGNSPSERDCIDDKSQIEPPIALGPYIGHILSVGRMSPVKHEDFEGADFGHRLELTDHNGVYRALADFKGKLVVLLFGYTHCADVCPTTLSEYGRGVQVDEAGNPSQVQVLFVTVDPERDTPEVLRQYVPYFDPALLGLYGTPEEIAGAAKEFHIVYQKHAEPGTMGYLVDHSAGCYVLDQQGRLRLFLLYDQPPADIAHDLELLLHGA